MKIAIENTSKIVSFNGIDCRVWEGDTEGGVPVIVFIPRIAVRNDLDTSQFEAELRETRAPSPDAEAWPLRMVL
jgi:hypothetical protein